MDTIYKTRLQHLHDYLTDTGLWKDAIKKCPLCLDMTSYATCLIGNMGNDSIWVSLGYSKLADNKYRFNNQFFLGEDAKHGGCHEKLDGVFSCAPGEADMFDDANKKISRELLATNLRNEFGFVKHG